MPIRLSTYTLFDAVPPASCSGNYDTLLVHLHTPIYVEHGYGIRMKPDALRMRVEETLLMDDELDASRIRVVVQGRDVWLEGEVPTPAMYDRAEWLAGEVGDVGVITNNLISTDEPYDIRAHRDGEDLRTEPSSEDTGWGLPASRVDPFGEQSVGAFPPEGNEEGGPVGGDAGDPIHPQEFKLTNPMAGDILGGDEPWRYQDDGPNAHLDPEPVLPPEEDEV